MLLCRWKNQRHIEKDPVQGRNGTVVALEVLGRDPMVVVPAVHLVVWTMFEGLITVSWMLISEPLFSMLSIDLFTNMWYDIMGIRLVTCLWLLLWLRFGCFPCCVYTILFQFKNCETWCKCWWNVLCEYILVFGVEVKRKSFIDQQVLSSSHLYFMR